MKLIKKIGNLKLSQSIILLFIITIPFVNFNHHKYSKEEGVIIWDIKSYYAYLPATFIYHDLSLEFIRTNKDLNFKKWIWPLKTSTGENAILTSCGLSMLYSPFFFIAHQYAKISQKYNADGYSKPYHVALTFSAFLYFILALFILRKILLKYFKEKTVALTLLFIGAGTNLFYYITYEAPMPHGYNFFLIVLFLWLLIRWYEKTNIVNSVFLGLTAGLIALVRPTNIIILLLIPLYSVNNFKTLKENFIKLLNHWYLILIMIISFIIIWIPQFAYWYYVSGKIFYFSYGAKGAHFFFNNPQITDFLFSYKKGWYVYTPIMLFATIGIGRIFKLKNPFALGTTIYLILIVYILSSWWSWWFGGAFGMRSMIDMYGIMAIPLAAFIEKERKIKFEKQIFISLFFILTFYNQFQIQQYRKGAIHYWWMNKEAYWTNFLHLHPTCKYWKIIQKPDYEKARKGIYVWIPSYDKHALISDSLIKATIIEDIKSDSLLMSDLKHANTSDSSLTDSLLSKYADNLIKKHLAEDYFKKLKLSYLTDYINKCKAWREEVEHIAKKENISYAEALNIEAKRVYVNYSEKYEDTFEE